MQAEPGQLLAAQGSASRSAWLALFVRAIELSDGIEGLPEYSNDVDGTPIPFEHALRGFVGAGREELERRTSFEERALLSPQARHDFERQLVRHLCFVASYALGHRWYEFRLEQAPASMFEGAWALGPRSTSRYRAFIDSLDGAGMLDLFEDFPVLARLLSTSVQQWADAIVEFIDRYRNDWLIIRSELIEGTASCDASIQRVWPDRSDRHHHGRTVLVLGLSDGGRLVYKPRPMAAERLLGRLIEILDSRDDEIDLIHPAILDAGDHGWSSFVARRDVHSAEEAQRYFFRAGTLLAVLHTLGISDIHYENLIPAGDHPVVVDAETLLDLSPPPQSVAEIGMLPLRETPGGPIRNLSPLGGQPAGEQPLPSWRHVNTDQMVLEDRPPSSHDRDEWRLQWNGQPVNPGRYVEDLVTGFEVGYFAVVKHRGLIRSDPKIGELLRQALPRVLLRPSDTYGRIHLHLLRPQFLRDGRDRSIELEWLAKPLTAPKRPDAITSDVYRREREAMERLDIPHLHSIGPSANRGMLLHRDRSVAAFSARLAAFGGDDLSAQVETIRRSFDEGAN